MNEVMIAELVKGRPLEVEIDNSYFMMGSHDFNDISYARIRDILLRLSGAKRVKFVDEVGGDFMFGKLRVKFEY
jgi:hypothetical protein